MLEKLTSEEQMSAKVKEHLSDIFKIEIVKLNSIIIRILSNWLKKYE